MRMCFVALVLLVAMQAWAGVNKCVGPDGKVTYSETPCATNSKSAQPLKFVENAIIDGRAIRAREANSQAQNQSGAANQQLSELERMRIEACKKVMEKPKQMGDVTRAIAACQALSGQPVSSNKNTNQNIPANKVPSSPVVITNCNNSGCFDNNGQFYAKSGGGAMVGQNGCQIIGGILQCP